MPDSSVAFIGRTGGSNRWTCPFPDKKDLIILKGRCDIKVEELLLPAIILISVALLVFILKVCLEKRARRKAILAITSEQHNDATSVGGGEGAAAPNKPAFSTRLVRHSIFWSGYLLAFTDIYTDIVLNLEMLTFLEFVVVC